MTVQTDQQFKLRDGRALGYVEYGEPQGKPVLPGLCVLFLLLGEFLVPH